MSRESSTVISQDTFNLLLTSWVWDTLATELTMIPGIEYRRSLQQTIRVPTAEPGESYSIQLRQELSGAVVSAQEQFVLHHPVTVIVGLHKIREDVFKYLLVVGLWYDDVMSQYAMQMREFIERRLPELIAQAMEMRSSYLLHRKELRDLDALAATPDSLLHPGINTFVEYFYSPFIKRFAAPGQLTGSSNPITAANYFRRALMPHSLAVKFPPIPFQ